jgi:hypothetical protein
MPANMPLPTSLSSPRLPATWLLLLAACTPASEAHTNPSRAVTDARTLRPQRSSASASTASPAASQSPIRDGSCEPLQVAVPAYPTTPLDPPIPRIEDDGHRAMRGFYERLASLMRGRAGDHVRIAIYGDSNMTLDLISGPMRRTIQKIHGDGGHGYVAVGMPWKWYDHWDVEHGINGPWATYTPSTVRIADWGFGIAGVTSITRTPGATATFSTAGSDSPVGRTAARFGVMYHVAPKGGAFDIQVDGKVEATVDTRQGDGPTGYRVVHVSDAPHRFQIVNRGKDQVRLYGVTLERDQPGVVLDMLGIVGISYYDIARFDESINASIVQQRPYDLVIYLVGLNSWMAPDNPASVARLAAFHRRVHPEVSLLILSPPDHTKKATDAHSEIQFVHIAEGLHKAALDNQCAFWDFREAMGGDGSMARFFHKNLAARDLYHFTRSGAAFMGSRLIHAVWSAFADYLAQHPSAGCAVNDVRP